MYEKKMNFWKKNNVSIFPKIYTILLRSAFGIRHSKAFGRIFVSIVALKKKKKKKKKNFRRRRRLLSSSFPGERVRRQQNHRLSKTTRERERENLTNEHAKGKERRRRGEDK